MGKIKRFLVREKGLEPPRLATLDPKSSVSTNFTTPARKLMKLNNNMIFGIIQGLERDINNNRPKQPVII